MNVAQRRHAVPIWPLFNLLLVACFVVCLPPAARAESSATSRKALAQAQYNRALKQRGELEAKSKNERTLKDYKEAVSAFRRVYLITPHFGDVPAALVAVAELYRDMGELFDAKYYQSAIDAYQFLLHEYPTNPFRQEAFLAVGEIQKNNLGDLDLAEKTFHAFVKTYPRSKKVADAWRALNEIDAARKQQIFAAEKEKQALEPKAEETAGAAGTAEVTSIRTWNAEDYTRVVVDLGGKVEYQAARLKNPDRIYFDLTRARLSHSLASKNVDVDSAGFLKNVRVAQNKTGVVRVVLDVSKVKDYSVFLLPNPYRLVVDVYGPGSTTANTEAPASRVAGNAKPPEQPQPRPKAALPVREEAAKLGPPPEPQPTRDGQRSLSRALGLKISRIVIDPGHGGHDTGTIGPTGLMEKDLCLDVALRLGRIIKKRLPGAEVVFTREDDSYIPLEERTAIANRAKADLFISVHANSSRDKDIRGIETYYLNLTGTPDDMEVASRENALSQSSTHELQDLIRKIARNDKMEESRELATDIQDSLSRGLQRVSRRLKNRGVRKAPFVVLIGANMPSVLSEIAFISNPADEKLLKRAENRERVAEGLYRGVEQYLQSINSLSVNQIRSQNDTRSATVASSANQR